MKNPIYDLLAAKYKLTPVQKQELEKDTERLINGAHEAWKQQGDNDIQVEVIANQRLTDGANVRYFRIEMTIAPSVDSVALEVFDELSLNEYLDTMSASDEELDGYLPLKG
ncbi:hypothetical protein [Pontibacter beigongshangensis]|uniref:hypothetical protein n=1 Tax=Pontibacter beigongshangensis TaxID=2574733 RepID=UPI0016508F5B|nr:hypothetical protein [Pontibacter beigongshangensis]